MTKQLSCQTSSHKQMHARPNPLGAGSKTKVVIVDQRQRSGVTLQVIFYVIFYATINIKDVESLLKYPLSS